MVSNAALRSSKAIIEILVHCTVQFCHSKQTYRLKIQNFVFANFLLRSNDSIFRTRNNLTKQEFTLVFNLKYRSHANKERI